METLTFLFVFFRVVDFAKTCYYSDCRKRCDDDNENRTGCI